MWAHRADGSAWMAGGSYLVARRIRMTVEAWDQTSLEDQERAVGRTKGVGAPLGAAREHDQLQPGMPTGSHVRLAHPSLHGGARMLRRGFSFVDGADQVGHLDAGLFFLAFQRDPRRAFVPVQAELSRRDAMSRYPRAPPDHRCGRCHRASAPTAGGARPCSSDPRSWATVTRARAVKPRSARTRIKPELKSSCSGADLPADGWSGPIRFVNRRWDSAWAVTFVQVLSRTKPWPALSYRCISPGPFTAQAWIDSFARPHPGVFEGKWIQHHGAPASIAIPWLPGDDLAPRAHRLWIDSGHLAVTSATASGTCCRPCRCTNATPGHAIPGSSITCTAADGATLIQAGTRSCDASTSYWSSR